MTDSSKTGAPVPPRAPAAKTATGAHPRPATATTAVASAPSVSTPPAGVATASLPSGKSEADPDQAKHLKFIAEIDDAASLARMRAKDLANRCQSIPTDREDLIARLREAESLARTLNGELDDARITLDSERAAHAATKAAQAKLNATLDLYKGLASRLERLLGETSAELVRAEAALERAGIKA